MNLRPYQEEAIAGVLAAFEKHRTALLVLSTGGGKTICFAKMAEHFNSLGQRTLVLAHREELLTQAQEKIRAATGLWAQIEKAEQRASMNAQIVVASVQTMVSRRDRWPADHFGLVVVDEAHHALAKSYLETLARFSSAKVLGVTATPDRGDKKNLGKVFETVAYEAGLMKLIKGGWLARITVKRLPIELDMRGVRKVAGDYKADEIGSAIEPKLMDVARAIGGECWDRKTVVFLPLVKTARKFAEMLNSVGIEARAVAGEDSGNDRREALDWFHQAGPGTALCNAMLLTEGWDQPDTDCVVVLRPTQVRALFAQMVGRGTRLAEGKSDCLLLDFLWMTEEHSLAKVTHLVTGKPEVAAALDAKFDEAARNGGEAADLIDEEETTSKDVEAERMRKVMERLKANRKRTPGTYDVIELATALNEADLTSYEPKFVYVPGHGMRMEDPPSARQKESLAKAGFDPESIASREHASKILDRLAVRRQAGLATPKQVRMLRRFGHPTPDRATFSEASAFIDRHFRGSIHPPKPAPALVPF